MNNQSVFTAAALAAYFVAGCTTLPQSATNADGPNPVARFDALEQRLVDAESVRIDFHITADGVIEVDLRGALHKTPTSEFRLTASGMFAGQAVELSLQTEGDRLLLDSAAAPSGVSRPEHLNEALMIGLTRMGLLHNLARLTGPLPPDHADGGVRQWVTVDGFTADPDSPRMVSFDITVAAQPAGSASLTLDRAGRPALRRQTVAFPSGEMRVLERYSAVTIEP